MRIVYKGTRLGKTRVAIITYGDNEENKAYEIAIKFRNITSYKVDTCVPGMLIIDVDDMSDYNNLKEWYKEFKKSNNTNDNKTTTDSNDTNDTKDTESDTNATNSTESNKTPAELKADINNKYGVNAVYYDTDSILCDNSKQNVYVAQHNETPQIYKIKAYYDGKELTIPYNEYKCKECVIEYIHNLFMERVIPYETLFILYYGKHAETKTIDNVLDVTDLIEYNIDDINNGLKNDCYKKVREGIERICSIITDDMKVCIDLHTGNNVNYCTITSTDNKGYYGFKWVKSTYIKKPSDFARWLYFRTFVRSIELKCWYCDLRGETKWK